MKNKIALLIFLTLLGSCGKNVGESPKSPIDQEAIIGKEGLSKEEERFKNKLINKNAFLQKDLILELAELSSPNQKVLKKLDHHINIQCIQVSGMCYITGKK